MTPRIARLKEKLIGDHTGTPEWRLLRYESLRQTSGKPLISRRAQAFAHFLENVPLEIDDDELLVGRLPIRVPTSEEARTLEEARDYFARHRLIVGVSYRVPPYYPEYELVTHYGKAGIFNAMRANHHIFREWTGTRLRRCFARSPRPTSSRPSAGSPSTSA